MFRKLFGRKETSDQKVKPKSGFTVREDDIFLVSYPKSGNTWLRFLFGHYITNGNMNFSNAHLLMPDVHFNPEQIDKITASPRFIKSHFQFQPEYKKVIYIYRDGRATAVSYYYFLLKMKAIPKETTFDEYLENYFFAGKSPYGHWNTHIFSWMRDNYSQDIYPVRYEDLLADTNKQFEKMLRFTGLEIDTARLELAVRNSSFQEMQKDEEKNSANLKMRGHVTGGENFRIVREGKTDSWKSKFSPEQLDRFNQLYGDAMSILSYPMNM